MRTLIFITKHVHRVLARAFILMHHFYPLKYNSPFFAAHFIDFDFIYFFVWIMYDDLILMWRYASSYLSSFISIIYCVPILRRLFFSHEKKINYWMVHNVNDLRVEGTIRFFVVETIFFFLLSVGIRILNSFNYTQKTIAIIAIRTESIQWRLTVITSLGFLFKFCHCQCLWCHQRNHDNASWMLMNEIRTNVSNALTVPVTKLKRKYKNV